MEQRVSNKASHSSTLWDTESGVGLAAGDKAGDAVAAAGLSRVAVAQVEAPADVVGVVGNGAVDGLVLDE